MITLLMIAIGAIGGFFSGLLGIGGAIIIVPMLLGIPQLFGMNQIPPHTVTGLSMVQVFLASLSGAVAHYRRGSFPFKLLIPMALAFSLAAFAGALLSAAFSGDVVLSIFSLILLASGVVLWKPRTAPVNSPTPRPHSLIAVGIAIGLLSGIAGIGGGLLIVPALTILAGIPLSKAVGYSLGVVCIGSLAGTVGKTVTGQIDWAMAAPLGIASIAFAQLGVIAHRKTPEKIIRAILLIVILLSFFGIWHRILT